MSDLLIGKAEQIPFFVISRGIRDAQGKILGIVAAALILAEPREKADLSEAVFSPQALGPGTLQKNRPSLVAVLRICWLIIFVA